MRQLFITSIILAMTTINSVNAQNQQLDFSKVKVYEHQLDDVMELIDTTELKIKLKEVEENYQQNPSEINKVRLGIIYHETALNLSFFSKTEFKGYAKKSFDTLSELFNSPNTTKELLPFIASYRASALSLVGAETKKLKLLGEAFSLFNDAVKNYSSVSYLPEFLRGSVAENLPWFFFTKRKFAKQDFQSIIDKQDKNSDYANWKIMSFTYWAWAKQRQSKKRRTQALAYLDKAIALDPNYKAGRKKAEELKTTLTK
jgi:tetratricopeptide (TPR) repeat protein